MAVTERTVRNKRNSAGELTGKAGTVYDVNVKYKSGGKSKTYSRKGFLTKKDALQHEAEMKAKLTNPAYTPPSAVQRKTTVQEYMTEWIDRHGSANLRPSTEASYRSHMKNHIFPYIGDVFLNQLSPAMLDDMYRQLAEKGLSQSSVKYAHRIMGVSLEHARRYHYISSNPARDILTKFGKQGKTPDPYTVDQMRQLLAVVMGTEWELIVVLGGLYGLRLSEIIGLRWRNVDLVENTFGVVEQLPFNTPANTTVISEMAPVKSSERTLPITPSSHTLNGIWNSRRNRSVLQSSQGIRTLTTTLYSQSQTALPSAGRGSPRILDSFCVTQRCPISVFTICGIRQQRICTS